MAPADLTALLRARPFTPFRIVTPEGVSYEIRHPELCVPGLSSVFVGYPGPSDPSAYERFDIVSIKHIIRLEPIFDSGLSKTSV